VSYNGRCQCRNGDSCSSSSVCLSSNSCNPSSITTTSSKCDESDCTIGVPWDNKDYPCYCSSDSKCSLGEVCKMNKCTATTGKSATDGRKRRYVVKHKMTLSGMSKETFNSNPKIISAFKRTASAMLGVPTDTIKNVRACAVGATDADCATVSNRLREKYYYFCMKIGIPKWFGLTFSFLFFFFSSRSCRG
jgi:hypothetical protein